MRGRISHSAFTLLELMLAMGMVAMLAAALYASLNTAFKARDNAAVITPIRAAHIAADMVCQDLGNALPPTGVLAGLFTGQPLGTNGALDSEIQFYCMVPAINGNSTDPTDDGGIAKVELAVDTPGNGHMPVLVRRLSRNLLSPHVPEVEEEILCRNVRSFSLRYFDGLAWQDTWDSSQQSNTLPAAVEVTLEIERPAVRGSEPSPYLVQRIVLLACHQDSTTTGATP